MADSQIGAYHLADNPTVYEPQRSNTFEFVVTDIDNILRVDKEEGDENATIPNASHILRFSVASSFVPTFQQNAIEIKRGNSVMKAAGVPSFSTGNLVINDYIGADGKSVLMAWQGLSYDVKNEKVGRMADYKKDCYLLEYTPDYDELVRTWRLVGCWISGLQIDDFNYDNDGKRTVTATVQYDKAYMEVAE